MIVYVLIHAGNNDKKWLINVLQLQFSSTISNTVDIQYWGHSNDDKQERKD